MAGDDLGLLRELLHEPSPQSWEQILDLLRVWSADALLEAVVHAQHHLRGWPAWITRSMPGRLGPQAGEEELLLRTLCSALWPVEELIQWPSWPRGAPAPLWRRLIVCDLRRRSRPQGVDEWLAGQSMPCLAQLTLAELEEDDAVQEASWWPQIEVLRLPNATDGGLLQLFEEQPMPRLRELDLGGSSASYELLESLLENPAWGALRKLSLRDCWLSLDAAELLASCGKLEQIEELDLRQNASMTAVGRERLLHSSRMPLHLRERLGGYREEILR